MIVDDDPTIVHYEAIAALSGVGEAIVRIIYGRIVPGSNTYIPALTLLIGMNPHKASILWVTRLRTGYPAQRLAPESLSYTCRDLAETLCRERFV